MSLPSRRSFYPSLVVLVGLVLSSCSTPSDTPQTQAVADLETTSSPQPACENPQLDLLETEFGLWGSPQKINTETAGKDNNYWLETDVIDNHFDPCADYSYIVIEGRPPEFVGSQLPPKKAVLFFAGEHFIPGQDMPFINEVKDISLDGATATVDYQSKIMYNGETFDYTINYTLSPQDVVEKGRHEPTGNTSNMMRTDFHRSPPPGDSFSYTRLGNISHKLYDYEEDWAGYYVNIPIGEITMRCTLLSSFDYNFTDQVDCLAPEPIFPPVDTRRVPAPLISPGEKGYYSVSMSFSYPTGIYTDYLNLGNADSFTDMKDEAITKVGNLFFDTRGDSVRITDYHMEYEIGPNLVRENPADEVDMSRWPTHMDN
ncbi:hypothetical protein [Corynebacterium sp. ES2775-CONJ]|uniref:hypothetical protein n=1 Tax=Corynebacterium sp. ES2775-CONJ TaxID=2974029 RepID=UPI002166F89E|nr:hypothetical protein [Corynebacterium sp. ES2775-CONJ]MCS4490517.1 hypothetical protein [Corynebacterium sp. ES2775-CONJ]